MALKRLLLFFSGIAIVLAAFADSYPIKSSFPADGQKLTSISRVSFEFDFSAYYTEDMDTASVGLYYLLSKRSSGKHIQLYKGDPLNGGTLLETYPNVVKEYSTYTPGITTASFNLSTTYTLEDSQLYTIVVTANTFFPSTDGTANGIFGAESWDGFSIKFYGGEEEMGESINFVSSDPCEGSELNKIGLLSLLFDGDIELAENATASLYMGGSVLAEKSIEYSSEDSKKATVDFGGIDLKATQKYSVYIPKNAVMLSGTNTTLSQPLTLSFTGCEYFGYETITPKPYSALTTIGKVKLVPNFPEGSTPWQWIDEKYGTYGDSVSLYKGVDEDGMFVGKYLFELDNDLKSVSGKVTAQLEPNVTYTLVLPQNLVPVTYYAPTASGTSQVATIMPGYYSEKTYVHYYGANTANKWSIKDNDQLDKLGLVSLMTGGEATVNEGAKMALYCGEDSIAAADLKASGTFCYADFGELTLEQDSVYSLVIPDSAIVNMPKTTQKFKGITKPAEYTSVTYKANGITIASDQVLKGSKVSVNMAMPDSIQLDSLMLNGEKVALADSVYAIDSLAADAGIEAVLTYIPTPAPETKFYAVDYKVLSVANDSTMLFTTSSTKVAEDSIFTFKAPELDENWSVEVSAGELADSTYSLTITSDTTIAVTCTFNGEVKYVDETASGVYTFESNQDITISTTQGKIVVEGAKAGDTINLYGLNGAKLGQWTVAQDKQTIDVNSGVYLVVVKGDAGKAAAKVSVK